MTHTNTLSSVMKFSINKIFRHYPVTGVTVLRVQDKIRAMLIHLQLSETEFDVFY